MPRQAIVLKRKRVLIDVDTQRDYLRADGACCIRNHRRVLANIRRVFAWARKYRVKTISTVLSNHIGEAEFCVENSLGQEKISYTLKRKVIHLEPDGTVDLERDLLQRYSQIVFHKRCPDPFDEPRVDRMLCEIDADEFIIIGVITEVAILETVLGLIQRGKKVTIISDAIGSHDKVASEIALRKMQIKGANIIETKNIAGNSGLHGVGACDCERCKGINRKKRTLASAAM